MGSGKRLKMAIQKHGVENFTKEILHIFGNEEDMKNKEKELVVLNENSYNLCEGGKGGWSYVNRKGLGLRTGSKLSEDSRKKISENKKGQKLSEETKSKISKNSGMKNLAARKKISETLSGIQKSTDHKQKISDAIKEWHQKRKAGIV
jgi:hypothetical protein